MRLRCGHRSGELLWAADLRGKACDTPGRSVHPPAVETVLSTAICDAIVSVGYVSDTCSSLDLPAIRLAVFPQTSARLRFAKRPFARCFCVLLGPERNKTLQEGKKNLGSSLRCWRSD